MIRMNYSYPWLILVEIMRRQKMRKHVRAHPCLPFQNQFMLIKAFQIRQSHQNFLRTWQASNGKAAKCRAGACSPFGLKQLEFCFAATSFSICHLSFCPSAELSLLPHIELVSIKIDRYTLRLYVSKESCVGRSFGTKIKSVKRSVASDSIFKL